MKKNLLRLLISSILLLSSTLAFAEYRVYQYYVKAKNSFKKDPSAYLVTSSLDPTSYISYHGGAQSIEIDLVNTWVCKGNTSKKELCNSPFTEMAKLEGVDLEGN